VIQKLRRNRQITSSDLVEVERIFLEAGFGTQEDIETVTREFGSLGLFLRSITGLDREAAAAAFDEFQTKHIHNADQLHYIGFTIDVVAKNGVLDVEVLYEPLFTNQVSGGPEVLFRPEEVDDIEAVLTSVRATAIPITQTA
jgi:type I restriction enzyme R subunit